MKKILLSMVVVLGMSATMFAQEGAEAPAQKSGQWLVGGGIDFTASSNKSSINNNVGDTWKSSYFGFGFTPRVGYAAEKWEAGLKIGMGYTLNDSWTMVTYNWTAATPDPAKAERDSRTHDFNITFTPYGRYRFFEVKGFAMWGEAYLNLGTQIETKIHYYAYGDATSDVQVTEAVAKAKNDAATGDKNYMYFEGRFGIKPVLTYDFNDHWRIEGELDFLSLNLGGNIRKRSAGTDISTTNNFDANIGLRQGRAMGINVVYKF